MSKAATSKRPRPAASTAKLKAVGLATWRERREVLRARCGTQPPEGLSGEELEAHFEGMPVHYWEQVSAEELTWELRTIHAFFKQVIEADGPATKPVMDSRPLSGSDQTRVLLCTWDRLGLLAKAVAAFSAVGVSIVRAEAFTRADNIVLDVFTVAGAQEGGPVGEARLREVLFLLDGSLSEPPRFTSLWMNSRHKFIVPAAQPPPRISFDNNSSDTATLVRLEAADRLGLLCDLFEALADAGLNITEAHIDTAKGVARDVVYVKDAQGNKVLAPERLRELGLKLEAALAIESAEVRRSS